MLAWRVYRIATLLPIPKLHRLGFRSPAFAQELAPIGPYVSLETQDEGRRLKYLGALEVLIGIP